MHRLGLTFAIAVGVGLLLSLHPRPGELVRSPSGLGGGAEPPPGSWPESLRRFAAGALGEFVEMGAVLVVGAALAALVQTLVPRAILLELGRGPVVSVAVMMAMAVVLSICSTVDAFVALAWAGTFTDGSLIAFLVLGPMIDIKSLLLMLTVFRPRVVLLAAVVVTEAVFLLGLGLNYWAR
jgi:uncharacterized membrane protein YraQ (UPF0718 family)